jgi:hypothetical protein
MSGLFDKLESEIADRSGEGGISPLDLADLPKTLRKIVRFMLREVEAKPVQINEMVQGLPKEERISEGEVSDALKTLTKQGWLIQLGEKEKISYRVNLRRKAGSKLGDTVWGALDQKLEQRMEERKKGKKAED